MKPVVPSPWEKTRNKRRQKTLAEIRGQYLALLRSLVQERLENPGAGA